jgi:uncharacterized membrane protein YgcG
MPTIFTTTPFESLMQAMFLKAQIALASTMGGTPVFRVLLFWVLGWSMVVGFIRMAAHKHRAGSLFLQIVYRIGMVFLAMGLLSWQYRSVTWTAPHGTAWYSMTGVNHDTRYSSTLGGDTPGLWSYLLLYGSMNEVSQLMSNSAASAFGDPKLSSDPNFLAKQLARMSAMALGPDTHRALEALNANCANTADGRVIGRTTTLSEMYDMTIPGCPALWAQFDAAAQANKPALMAEYPAYVAAKVSMPWQNWFGFRDPNQLQNIAFANALLASERNQFGASNYGRFWNSGNLSANDAATVSTSGDRYMEDQSKGLVTGWIADMFDAVSNWGWGGNFQQAARKAEAANKFNMLGPMIPAARGMIQGLLSLLFVLAAYSVGFGTWKWMRAWLMAQASFSLYRPAATIGFACVTYFTEAAKLTKAAGDIANDPYILGGALQLQEQLAELQTVYICFELGCFVVFTLGAIAAFKPVSAMTNAAGLALAGQAEKVVETAARFAVQGATGGVGGAGAGGGGGGAPVVVSMSGGSGGGGSAAGGGNTGGAGNGTGIITPSATPPSQWDDRAA